MHTQCRSYDRLIPVLVSPAGDRVAGPWVRSAGLGQMICTVPIGLGLIELRTYSRPAFSAGMSGNESPDLLRPL